MLSFTRHWGSLGTLTLALLATRGLEAQAGLRPQPSGRATAEVVLAYPQGRAPAGATPASLRLDYGVPHLRGRMLHTGDLVPYGAAWRTGANATTTLTTGADIVLGGTAVPKGTYVLYTIPTREAWTLVLQRSAGQSATEYDQRQDFARIPLRVTALPHAIESLSAWFIPSTDPALAGGELRLAWGTTQLSVDWRVAP